LAITCVPESRIAKAAEIPIVPVVGPEVIAGSTRMKAGTAQKLVLNMISTATMIRLGYVTGNRMTNVQTRNIKLRARAVRIIQVETGLAEEAAVEALDAADGELPVALVMTAANADKASAQTALANSSGVVAAAIESLRK
jgi:N-acetylmuramic acid 6-phosphate etherase